MSVVTCRVSVCLEKFRSFIVGVRNGQKVLNFAILSVYAPFDQVGEFFLQRSGVFEAHSRNFMCTLQIGIRAYVDKFENIVSV